MNYKARITNKGRKRKMKKKYVTPRIVGKAVVHPC